jgi:hypothetical protein
VWGIVMQRMTAKQRVLHTKCTFVTHAHVSTLADTPRLAAKKRNSLRLFHNASFDCGQLNPAPSRMVHVARLLQVQARLNVALLTLTRNFCRHTHTRRAQ